jgi:hypothetical protein
MDSLVLNQIQILQELRNKCLETTGYYGDVDTAVAALQICSTFGMDNTARLLGILNNNGIKTHEDLLNVITDSRLNKSLRVIKNESNEVLCPNSNSKLENQTKHCSECGQKLDFENLFLLTIFNFALLISYSVST